MLITMRKTQIRNLFFLHKVRIPGRTITSWAFSLLNDATDRKLVKPLLAHLQFVRHNLLPVRSSVINLPNRTLRSSPTQSSLVIFLRARRHPHSSANRRPS